MMSHQGLEDKKHLTFCTTLFKCFREDSPVKMLNQCNHLEALIFAVITHQGETFWEQRHLTPSCKLCQFSSCEEL